jgi:hypothetical protein
MKILALIFFSTTVIKGFAHFTRDDTYEYIEKMIGAIIYLIIAIASYYWLLTQFLTFK